MNNQWSSIFDQKGSYKCGLPNCGTYAHMSHRKKEVTGINNRTHRTKLFNNCGTSYMIYGLMCPCGLLYVGWTSCALRVRIREYKSSIICKKEKYSVPWHFLQVHNERVEGLRVFGIEAMDKELDKGKRYQPLDAMRKYNTSGWGLVILRRSRWHHCICLYLPRVCK